MGWEINWTSLIGGIVGFLGVLSAAVQRYKNSGVENETIKILKENNEALKEQNDILTGNLEAERKARVESDKKIAELQGKYDTLFGVVTAALQSAPPSGFMPTNK